MFSNYYLAFRKEDSNFFFLEFEYDKNYPNFLSPGSQLENNAQNVYFPFAKFVS